MNGAVDGGFKQILLNACFHVSILGKSDSDAFRINSAESLIDL